MGRILAGVLFVAACVGDRPEVAPQPGADLEPSVNASAVRYAPQACGEDSWYVKTDGPIEISVAPRRADLQVLSVPLAGGAISAFTFDKGTNLQAMDPAIELGTGITAVSAGRIGSYLVATGTDASSLRVSVLTNDLAAAFPLVTLQPGLVARSAFQTVGGKTVLPVADDQGLRLETFDQTFSPTTARLATTEPAVAMTAASTQDATVAAWSTATACHLMMVMSPSPGPMFTSPGACLAPALAIDPTTQLGALVFEGNDGIRMLPWDQKVLGGVSRLVAIGGTSPRAVFDGGRLWISYLDAHQHIVAGYLDGGQLVSTTLTGTHPLASAYDLVEMDGAVWAVSYQADAFSAQRVCVLPAT